MTLDTMNAVLLAIAFLVPGFILSSILAITFRRRSSSAAELTLQYLTFSCLNYGFWSWLIVLMIQGDWLREFPIAAALFVFIILFVSPVGLGLMARRLGKTEIVQRVLAAVGFKIHRFIPTAWDYRFEQEQPSWIIVRLKDGSSVYGFFGNRSFAGDDPAERDLLIEAVFRPNDDGHWQPVADTDGILIKASEIATIEFRRFASDEGAV